MMTAARRRRHLDVPTDRPRPSAESPEVKDFRPDSRSPLDMAASPTVSMITLKSRVADEPAQEMRSMTKPREGARQGHEKNPQPDGNCARSRAPRREGAEGQDLAMGEVQHARDLRS